MQDYIWVKYRDEGLLKIVGSFFKDTANGTLGQVLTPVTFFSGLGMAIVRSYNNEGKKINRVKIAVELIPGTISLLARCLGTGRFGRFIEVGGAGLSIILDAVLFVSDYKMLRSRKTKNSINEDFTLEETRVLETTRNFTLDEACFILDIKKKKITKKEVDKAAELLESQLSVLAPDSEKQMEPEDKELREKIKKFMMESMVGNPKRIIYREMEWDLNKNN